MGDRETTRTGRTGCGRAGFTLVEIMIVVMIIGVVAAVAIPSFAKARQTARAMKMVNDLRVIHDAFNMYAMDNGTMPQGFGNVPEPVGLYLKNAKWDRPTSLGGHWLYIGFADINLLLVDDLYYKPGQNPISDPATWQLVDKKIDDGNLARGDFRLIANYQMYYNLNGHWN